MTHNFGLIAAEAPELEALFARRPQVIKPGLSRIKAALAAIDGEALLATPTVLVGGTNGKGTTSGFLWQLMTALGWQVGLFTSPHLQHFAERIQTSHIRVDNELLVSELAKLEQDLPASVYEPLSFFEINTLLALRVFLRANTDLNILEVGLGGRWDSTNATQPCLSIITSIGLDHQQWLGTTTETIAREKAGIMRSGCPVIWGGESAGDRAAIETLRQEATRHQAQLWEQGQHFTADKDGLNFLLPGYPAAYHPWPRIAHQWPPFMRDNFAKACAALVWLLHSEATLKSRRRLGITDSNSALASAIAAINTGRIRVTSCMRGRFEITSVPTHDQGPRNVLLDVCHNIAGANALVAGIRASGLLEQNKTLPGLVSILADKDCDEILDILRPVLAPLALFATTSERSWTPERLASRHRDLPFLASFAEAWAAPVTIQPMVICGSVHAVGEVTAALGITID